MKNNQNRKGWKKALRIGGITIGSMIGVVGLLVALILIITVITPTPLVTSMQKYSGMVSGDVNSFQPKAEPTKTTLSDGTLFLSDIQYGEKYPNSYLDIYIPNGDTKTKRPTLFYVHGGGFAWGDKIEGDPLAK